MKHINIPVFVPHMGCPNKCVFCDQRAISGVRLFDPEDAVRTVETHLATAPGDAEVEIAFFGGSFTGIDRRLMISLLDMAQGYVRDGKVAGIRMSTRPDYIDREIVNILKEYAVTAVELGVQSMNGDVLSASKRGHTPEDSRRAFRLLREAGIASVGQMMVGLPMSTREDEILTAEEICASGASGSRIYPTVVFENTELYGMMRAGKYTPLTVGDAVSRSADALYVFASHGVPCLRVSLYGGDTPGGGEAAAGPLHPALGELVLGEYYRRLITEKLDALTARGKPSRVTVFVPKGDVSAAIGHRGANRVYFSSRYGDLKIIFLEKEDIIRYNIILEVS
ncbi:MAG: radical SAM protein [Clostridia bacterium]|nr:radical SAM protein [Clostridia bacterium]MBR3639035.1 radical SAM protein [Clostridia bacterium]